MRKKIVIGNWKMNKTPLETAEFVQNLKDEVKESGNEVAICPPYTSLFVAANTIAGSKIMLGAQNMHYAPNGTFTGEVSADMLAEFGVKVIIIGHSERREFFNETNEMINKKILTALDKNITPVLCVNETWEQHENNTAEEALAEQLTIAFKEVSADKASKVIVAYEPIWAISSGDGTGKSATTEEANEMCKSVRKKIEEMYDKNVAEKIRILYGGSVNEKNALEILSQEHVDGALVGGASLSVERFSGIANVRVDK